MIKCLVWDLDNTIWCGTLMEEDKCRLKSGIKSVLEGLDRRGILHSIASANDEDLALSVLERKGISDFFLYPQINWSNKVASIQTIADKLDIGLDTMGFVDDEPYEREQVRQILPPVHTYPAEDYRTFLDRPELNPMFRTYETSQRRKMYNQESRRAKAQKQSGKSHKEFLRSCQTQMTIREAKEEDLPRILELMHRTHQLNATGKIYEQDEVISFLTAPNYRIYVVELKDRFVNYGKIGVAICECRPEKWQLFSFLLSCRVLTRGIGYFFLSWLQYQAYRCGASEFEGSYTKHERNHRMQMLYSLSGFRPKQKKGDGSVLFAKTCQSHLSKPDWFTLQTEDLG
jgi:FkbH-like protein